MVRKILTIFVCLLVFCAAMCGTTQAATNGNNSNYVCSNLPIETSVVEFFKSFDSEISLNDNYVLFRLNEDTYIFVIGDLKFNENKKIVCNSVCSIYNYQPNINNLTFNTECNNFELDCSNCVVYSNLGHYPELINRGDKVEEITLFIIVIALLCVIVFRIFRHN